MKRKGIGQQGLGVGTHNGLWIGSGDGGLAKSSPNKMKDLSSDGKKKTVEERISNVENNPRLNRRIERREGRVENKKERAKDNPEKLKKIEKKYGYNYDAALKGGGGPDESGHWASINPDNGMILKGPNHPSIMKTRKIERILGNKIVKKNGERYSIPKKK